MVFIHDKLNGIIALDAWAGRNSIYMEQYTKMIVSDKINLVLKKEQLYF